MIYVFGSCNVDMVMQVDRHPHPGETILCAGYKLFAGGKGANQAVAAARAGAKVAMVGCIGNDQLSDLLLASLKASQVDSAHIQRVDSSTGCAVIAVDKSGENTIIVASGANNHLTADHFPFHQLVPDDVVLFQMETPLEETWAAIRGVKERGARVILNLAPACAVPPDGLVHVDVLIVNEHEIQTFKKGAPPLDSAEAVATWLAKKFEITVVVTLGSKGLVAMTAHQTFALQAAPITVIDTVGAGDTFAGYFAESYSSKKPLEQSLVRGLVGSGLACTKEGAQAAIPESSTVEAFIRHHEALLKAHKENH